MLKKVLTCALLTGVSFYAADAVARSHGKPTGTATSTSPKVEMSGYLRAAAFGFGQKVRSGEKEVRFMSNGDMTFNAGGKTNNGITYGALAVLELDRSKSSTSRISEAYVYFSSDMLGSFQFGDTNGVGTMMMYDGTDVLGGVGGYGGQIDKIVNVTRGVDINQDTDNIGESRATKINYISPVVSGFQLGLSYTPSTEHYGRVQSGRTLTNSDVYAPKTANPFVQNKLETALSYNHVFGPYSVGLFGTYKTGNVKSPRTEDYGVSPISMHHLEAWQLGTLVDYNNWQFGGSYFDNGKSGMRKNTTHKNTNGFNFAVGYGMGPTSVAVGYTQTERRVTTGKAKADMASITVDHSLAKGLVAFAEANYFSFKAPTAHVNTADFTASTDVLDRRPPTNTDNHGSVFVLGTKVMF
jgi:hypothetical protein